MSWRERDEVVLNFAFAERSFQFRSFMGTPEKFDFNTMSRVFAEQELFADKTWMLSPEPFAISADLQREIEAVGSACLSFHIALERLYRWSVEGRRILRNAPTVAPWVAAYLDRGKPARLLAHGRHPVVEGELPVVLRPDILLTGDGLAVTEIDAVPGGVGLTAFLNRFFGRAFEGVIGAPADAMLEGFYRSLAAKVPDSRNPVIAIVVSDEAQTYRPEMEWLATELQKRGKRVMVCHPSELMPLADAICVSSDGDPQKIDLVYRFWELFDLPNLSLESFLYEAVEEHGLKVSPPMRAFQEEKLALALFHHPRLAPYWAEQMGKAEVKLLRKVFPMSWVVDPEEVSPNAVLHAPPVSGRPPFDWSEVGAASKKERDLILKISGFDETAWGARSVTLGSDVSREDWSAAVSAAVNSGKDNLFILQRYRKPRRVSHPYYDNDGSLREAEWRVRLCPYFFVENGEAQLRGILATLCPADKKIIHGMRDAVLLPVRVE